MGFGVWDLVLKLVGDVRAELGQVRLDAALNHALIVAEDLHRNVSVSDSVCTETSALVILFAQKQQRQ